MNNFYISPNLSNFLNFLRWFSAFIVVIGHLRSILFHDIHNTNIDSILWKFFYFITGFGHQAVIVFFVVSGFLVSGSMLRRYKKGELNIKYLIYDRATRIYIVLIPALIFTALIDFIGINYFNVTGIYTNHLSFSSLNYSIENRLSYEVFIGNLFMLQETFFKTFGSNSPLWSLAYEVWYYIYFFAILSFFLIKNNLVKMILLSFISILSILLNSNILLYGTIWLLGVIPWYIKTKISYLYILTIIILFFTTLIVSRLHIIHTEFYIDFLFAISIMGLILVVKNNFIKPYIFFHKVNKILANFSYTLYLIHFPIIIFLISLLNKYFMLPIQSVPSINRLFIFMLIIAIIYIVSIIFAKFTEDKTKIIQKRLLDEN